MIDHDLDRRLREWDDHQRATPERVEALARRVALAARDQRRSRWPAPSRPAQLVAAALVGGLAAASLLTVLHRSGGDGPADLPTAAISIDAVRRTGAMVGRLEAEFPEGIREVIRRDGHLEIRTATERSQERLADRALTLKVSVVQRPRAGRWQVRSSVEVVAAPDAVIGVDVGDDGAGRVELWPHRLPDGLVLVEGRATLTDPVDLAVTLSRVLEPGVAVPLLTAAGDEGEVALVVAVQPLEVRGGPTT